MTILVTGAAGFIGSHVVHALLARGETIIGVDNLNDYYTPALKHARLETLKKKSGFTFIEGDISGRDDFAIALNGLTINSIIHLAAQAGVRYSLEAPFSYTDANITGHLNLLEYARHNDIAHMVYASSSSIYGRNTKTPFTEEDKSDLPASLYGATKKANELMASSYAHLYQIPLTGLRFFTVYGPWGRPDMAYWMFTEKILKGEPINIFNHGKMGRDFTYIDDIVDGVIAAHDNPPGAPQSFHDVYNLGNDHPEELMTMVSHLETLINIEATKNMMPMQAGDVERTWADISKAKRQLGYSPKVSLQEGLSRYVDWRMALDSPF